MVKWATFATVLLHKTVYLLWVNYSFCLSTLNKLLNCTNYKEVQRKDRKRARDWEEESYPKITVLTRKEATKGSAVHNGGRMGQG